ncbi:MAG: M12 family metallo-peptidase, partial [Bacteroidota bacterium]|nr:M12 family metallo-peptidase [Bacteroidota bacterium]
MRKSIIFLFFIVFNLASLFAQDNVFTYSYLERSLTKDDKNTKALHVDIDVLKLMLNSQIINIKLPLIDNDFLDVTLERFSVLSENHNLIIETVDGQKTEDYKSDFKSYTVLYKGESIGLLLFLENSVIVSYKYGNRQFEINKVEDQFFLFDINDCLVDNTFSCEVEEKVTRIDINESRIESSANTPKCLELAIEIDQYTRNLYSSNTATTNWALAIMAGVSQVFDSEVNLQIQVVNTIIWQTTDPYASYVNQASSMLSALRNHWNSNNSSISRDLVHLMTRRTNTGTGGIAYRDVLCSNSWGYAFSANLNNNTNFNFPNPSYTWNLFVCSHEIGHNIEAHHTHWCGWPGG